MTSWSRVLPALLPAQVVPHPCRHLRPVLPAFPLFLLVLVDLRQFRHLASLRQIVNLPHFPPVNSPAPSSSTGGRSKARITSRPWLAR